MTQTYVVYENPAMQERLEVQAPIRSLVDVQELARELGIPDYTDLDGFQVRKAVVTLWACKHPEKSAANESPESFNVALFGGGAFKLHCPSANKGPFARKIGDVDFATLKENGKNLVEILCGLSEKFGNMFYHGIPATDKRFNALRAHSRYRLRTIKDLDANDVPIPGILDIFCDQLVFCHKLDVREELKDVNGNCYTIGLENMLIAKAQMIKLAPKHTANLDQNRILGEFDNRNLLLGMETKDLQDVAAELLDHEIGHGFDKINLDVLGPKLKQNWGTWKTVTMNLRNMHQKLPSIISTFGGQKEQEQIIEERLATILEAIDGRYAARKSLSLGKQWWEDVEEQAL
jgi:hypothetical protein